MEDPLETFTLLPLHLDPKSKAVTSLSVSTSSSTKDPLTHELETLNALHKSLLTLETPIPGPPIPVHPKRSTQVSKLRESGNDSFRKSDYPSAIRNYTIGLQMALSRPAWEATGIVRDEVAGLYANRAQAYMAQQEWVEGSIDAECSVEAKRVGNAKAWWRRGKCLMEMGELEEAREWVQKGMEVEGGEGDLASLAKEITRRIEARKISS